MANNVYFNKDGSIYIGDKFIWNEIRRVQEALKERGFEVGNIKAVAYSARYKNKLACTSVRKDGTFCITFNTHYLEVGTLEKIKSTIAHEVVHTVPGAFNHSPYFKKVGASLSPLGYQVVTHSYDPKGYGEYLETMKQQKPYYKTTCAKCGHRFKNYNNFTPMLKEIVKPNQTRFFCNYCHSYKFTVAKVQGGIEEVISAD